MEHYNGATWEVYRQDAWAGDGPPEGAHWEPFAASAVVAHDGQRASLGGGLSSKGETIWWRRKEPPQGTAGTREAVR